MVGRQRGWPGHVFGGHHRDAAGRPADPDRRGARRIHRYRRPDDLAAGPAGGAWPTSPPRWRPASAGCWPRACWSGSAWAASGPSPAAWPHAWCPRTASAWPPRSSSAAWLRRRCWACRSAH
ncbi:hypothetical protein G6F32_014707 [Rhizopus arrhizus]|nr:hypothetical protein G6F32_014707 [Rhizopus arrhizus]